MNTSKQLKDLINNKAKQYNLNPQILLTRFFMERFLERISLSKYKNNFVLKGGILISSMVDAMISRYCLLFFETIASKLKPTLL